MKLHLLSPFSAAGLLLLICSVRAQDVGVKKSNEIVNSLAKPPAAGQNTRSWGPKVERTRQMKIEAPAQISTQAILFKFGSTDIEGEGSFAQIKELGKALSDPQLKDAVIEIQGHTDNVGSDGYNRKLSDARARKIVDELRQHYDLTVKKLVPAGKGKDEPVAGTKEKQSESERAQNRRVVIKRLDTAEL
jgi:outer membrane protein OmpA-like peptidoglycan-associated protein